MSQPSPIQVAAEATLTSIRAAGNRVRTGVRTVFARVAHAARGRPWLAAVAAAAVLSGGIGAAVALTQPGDSALLDVFRLQRPGLRELARRTREQPRSASAWTAYGKALFDAGQRRGGIRAYERALALDPGSADGAVVEDLLACFGRPEQPRAERLIARHRLARAAGGLERLARDGRHPVRWGAVRTLERLGKADRNDYVRAWILDLEAPDCEVRRNAADKLGASGDRQALARLRAARKREEAEPWYRPSCLGGRAERAEKRILARR